MVILQVIEGKVGRLRIRGSRYFSLSQIRKQAPSLAEGTVPNFNDVTRDIDNRRILWAAEDIIRNRPALSRWHPDFKDEFDAFVTGEAPFRR